VLRLTGASVRTAWGAETIGILSHESFDLVLFCHTVTKPEKDTICAEARKLHTSVRVLNVLKFSGTDPATDETLADPRLLLEKVTEALKKQLREQQVSR
jgi:hypothetical protein